MCYMNLLPFIPIVSCIPIIINIISMVHRRVCVIPPFFFPMIFFFYNYKNSSKTSLSGSLSLTLIHSFIFSPHHFGVCVCNLNNLFYGNRNTDFQILVLCNNGKELHLRKKHISNAVRNLYTSNCQLLSLCVSFFILSTSLLSTKTYKYALA